MVARFGGSSQLPRSLILNVMATHLKWPCDLKGEIWRQPLILNGHVMDSTEQQVGERSHIEWDGWAWGPAQSLRVSRDTFRHLGMATLVTAAGGVRGD